jgi:hypothetical protein
VAEKDPQIEGLEQIVKAISTPSSRRRFKEDPASVLKDPSSVPKDVLDLFAEMTPAELRLVSQLNTTLCKNKYTSDKSGTVCIV